MIQLTNQSGKAPLYIDPERINSVSSEGGGTAIKVADMAGTFIVREAIQQVLELIEKGKRSARFGVPVSALDASGSKQSHTDSTVAKDVVQYAKQSNAAFAEVAGHMRHMRDEIVTLSERLTVLEAVRGPARNKKGGVEVAPAKDSVKGNGLSSEMKDEAVRDASPGESAVEAASESAPA